MPYRRRFNSDNVANLLGLNLPETPEQTMARLAKETQGMQARLQSQGVEIPPTEGQPSLLTKGLKVLNVPGATVRGLIRSVVDPAFTVGDIHPYDNPTETSDILGAMGLKPENKFAAGAANFVGDVLTDPLTYLSGGIIKGLEVGLPFAKGAQLTERGLLEASGAKGLAQKLFGVAREVLPAKTWDNLVEEAAVKHGLSDVEKESLRNSRKATETVSPVTPVTPLTPDKPFVPNRTDALTENYYKALEELQTKALDAEELAKQATANSRVSRESTYLEGVDAKSRWDALKQEAENTAKSTAHVFDNRPDVKAFLNGEIDSVPLGKAGGWVPEAGVGAGGWSEANSANLTERIRTWNTLRVQAEAEVQALVKQIVGDSADPNMLQYAEQQARSLLLSDSTSALSKFESLPSPKLSGSTGKASNAERNAALPEVTNNYLKPLSAYAPNLYREVNVENAFPLIPKSQVSESVGELYFANTPEMALGQGDNKGILLEFDSANIKGHVNTQKPSWKFSWENGDGEFIGKNNEQRVYQEALSAMTIKPDLIVDKFQQRRLSDTVSRLEKSGWTKTKNADGSITYRRPELKPESISTTTNPLNVAGSAVERVGLVGGEPLTQVQSDVLRSLEEDFPDHFQLKNGRLERKPWSTFEAPPERLPVIRHEPPPEMRTAEVTPATNEILHPWQNTPEAPILPPAVVPETVTAVDDLWRNAHALFDPNNLVEAYRARLRSLPSPVTAHPAFAEMSQNVKDLRGVQAVLSGEAASATLPKNLTEVQRSALEALSRTTDGALEISGNTLEWHFPNGQIPTNFPPNFEEVVRNAANTVAKSPETARGVRQTLIENLSKRLEATLAKSTPTEVLKPGPLNFITDTLGRMFSTSYNKNPELMKLVQSMDGAIRGERAKFISSVREIVTKYNVTPQERALLLRVAEEPEQRAALALSTNLTPTASIASLPEDLQGAVMRSLPNVEGGTLRPELVSAFNEMQDLLRKYVNVPEGQRGWLSLENMLPNYAKHETQPMSVIENVRSRKLGTVQDTSLLPREPGTVSELNAERIAQGKVPFETDYATTTASRGVKAIQATKSYDLVEQVLANPEWASKLDDYAVNAIKDLSPEQAAMQAQAFEKLRAGDKLGDMRIWEGGGKLRDLGKHVVTPDVYDALTKVDKYYANVTDASIQPFLHAFDWATSKWRPWVTVRNPAYHVNNLAGNLWNMFLGGISPAEMPLRLRQGYDILKDAEGAVATRAGTLTYQEAKRLAVDSGAIGHGYQFAESSLEGLRQELGPVTNRANPLARAGAKYDQFMIGAGTTIEDSSRLALFVDEMSKLTPLEGMTGEAAFREMANRASLKVKEYLFDFTDMTPFEKQVLRRVMPFWSWTRNNLPLQIREFINQPGKFALIRDAKVSVEQMSDDPNAPRPEYLNEAVRTPFKTGEGAPVYFNPRLPAQDISRIPIIGPGNTGKEMLGMLNPLLKVPLELATGRNFFTGRPIERYPEETTQIIGGARVPTKAAFVANEFAGVLGKTGSALQAFAPDATATDTLRLVRTVFPGLYTYDPQKESVNQLYRQVDQLNNLRRKTEDETGRKVPTLKQIGLR